jgi:hypothetical protein
MIKIKASAHPDQIAILNFIRKAGKPVTVRDVEKSRFGGTPWFKAWLQAKQPRKDVVMTEDDVRKAKVELPPEPEPRNIVDDMLKSSTTRSIPWNDEQSIMPNNRIFAIVVPAGEVDRLFAPYGDAAVRFMKDYNQKAQQSGHPVIPNMVILAWVRYSQLDDGTLWVHEVQTDLPWAVGARHVTQQDVRQAMSRGGPMSKEANYYIREVIKQRQDHLDEQMKLLNFEVFKEFVAKNYDSAHRIVFPTMNYRLSHYPPDLFGDKAAPASIYNELPRKMRFQKQEAESLGLEEETPPGEVWLFASTVSAGVDVNAAFAEVNRVVREVLFGYSTRSLVQASTSEAVEALVEVIAGDADIAAAVLSHEAGERPNGPGLAKLRALAAESGSEDAKLLLRKLRG